MPRVQNVPCAAAQERSKRRLDPPNAEPRRPLSARAPAGRWPPDCAPWSRAGRAPAAGRLRTRATPGQRPEMHSPGFPMRPFVIPRHPVPMPGAASGFPAGERRLPAIARAACSSSAVGRGAGGYDKRSLKPSEEEERDRCLRDPRDVRGMGRLRPLCYVQCVQCKQGPRCRKQQIGSKGSTRCREAAEVPAASSTGALPARSHRRRRGTNDQLVWQLIRQGRWCRPAKAQLPAACPAAAKQPRWPPSAASWRSRQRSRRGVAT
jgi:hypothetical protein